MIWFIVLAVLVIVAVTGWLMSRRRHTSSEPRMPNHFNPSDVRAHVETHDVMGSSFRSGLRKDPGSRGH